MAEKTTTIKSQKNKSTLKIKKEENIYSNSIINKSISIL